MPINRRQQVFPTGTLIVENVQRSLDQGTYTCVAKNAQGFSAKGNLEVQVMGEWCTFHPFQLDTSDSTLLAENSNENFKKKIPKFGVESDANLVDKSRPDAF